MCGDDALAYRTVEELTANYAERVTVLLGSADRGYGRRIAQLPGVRVIERPELDGSAFTAAQVSSARAMALMGGMTWPTFTPRCGPRSSTRICGW